MKKYLGSTAGISKHEIFNCSLNDLIEMFGKPHNENGCEKVDYEWNFELSSGEIISIYNYKYTPKLDEKINWSIAAHSKKDAEKFLEYLKINYDYIENLISVQLANSYRDEIRINWSAIGSVSPERAVAFARRLLIISTEVINKNLKG